MKIKDVVLGVGHLCRRARVQRWPNFFEMDKIILSKHMRSCHKFKICPDLYAFLEQLGQKGFGAKNSIFFASEMHYLVAYIAHLVHILSGIYCIYIVPN